MMRTIVPLIAGVLLVPTLAYGEEQPIRIGVLNDMSGPYADYQGLGSVVAAQMAVEDYGGKVAGRKIEVISGDHQNKADIGASLARQWFDTQGVEAIVDLPNSAVALAVNQVVKDKNKAFIASGAGTAELTGAQCTPNTVAWTYDTWELGHARSAARSLVRIRSLGSSSRPTMLSDTICKNRRVKRLSKMVARCSDRSMLLWALPIFLPT